MKHLKHFKYYNLNESVTENSIKSELDSVFKKTQKYLQDKKDSYKSDFEFPGSKIKSIFDTKLTQSQILGNAIESDFDVSKISSKTPNLDLHTVSRMSTDTISMNVNDVDDALKSSGIELKLLKEYSKKTVKIGLKILNILFTYPLHLLKKYLYKLSLDCGHKFEISNKISLKATIAFLLTSICFSIKTLMGVDFDTIDSTITTSILVTIGRCAGSLYAFAKRFMQTVEEHSKFYTVNDFFDDINSKFKSITGESIPSDYAIDIEKWMNTMKSEPKEKVSEYFKILKNIIVENDLRKIWVIKKISETNDRIKKYIDPKYDDWASTDAKGISEIFDQLFAKLLNQKNYTDYQSYGSE